MGSAALLSALTKKKATIINKELKLTSTLAGGIVQILFWRSWRRRGRRRGDDWKLLLPLRLDIVHYNLYRKALRPKCLGWGGGGGGRLASLAQLSSFLKQFGRNSVSFRFKSIGYLFNTTATIKVFS